MKRLLLFFFVFSLILGSLGLSSCSKKEESNSNAGNPSELKVLGYYNNGIPKLKTPGVPVVMMFTGDY
jgi:hypothetical protein